MLSYSHSHHWCRFQKLMAIYLKFKGISAKGFDSLHAIGLTMSHKWTSDAVEHISNHCMKEVCEWLDKNAWTISYDNVQIPFCVFSQHLDNKDKFGNGTAATVYIKQNVKPLSDDMNFQLQKKWEEGLKSPLTELEIIQLTLDSHTCIQNQTEYIILCTLLESPDFKFKTYSGKTVNCSRPHLLWILFHATKTTLLSNTFLELWISLKQAMRITHNWLVNGSSSSDGIASQNRRGSQQAMSLLLLETNSQWIVCKVSSSSVLKMRTLLNVLISLSWLLGGYTSRWHLQLHKQTIQWYYPWMRTSTSIYTSWEERTYKSLD